MQKDNSIYCCYCGREFSFSRYRTDDHLIPVSKGGSNKILNRRNCCRHCNTEKKDYYLEQWLELVKEKGETYDNNIKIENILYMIEYVRKYKGQLFKKEENWEYYRRRYLKVGYNSTVE